MSRLVSEIGTKKRVDEKPFQGLLITYEEGSTGSTLQPDYLIVSHIEDRVKG